MDQQGLPISTAEIEYAENFLAAGDIATALPYLLELTDAVEEYAAEACQATDSRQYFSFADDFERLAYRRIERDPRVIVQIEVPFDRLYADLAYAYVQEEEFALARDALMQAVRWNPMECTHRLDLAELYRVLGDEREWAALSLSVVERASDARSLGLAYANLGVLFLNEEDLPAARGCLVLAERYAPGEARVERLKAQLAQAEAAAGAEPPSERAALKALGAQGVPTGPVADIAVCLLSCASDSARAGDVDAATNLTVRARDLIGQEACTALIKLIHESDAELADEARGKGKPGAARG